MLRGALLQAAANPWLARRLPNSALGRRAARRFMPGERLEDALSAATVLRKDGIKTVLTHLGEEVTDAGAADAAAKAYSEAIAGLARAGLDPHVSVKPTHLGLSLDARGAVARTEKLVKAAAAVGGFLWIDMEGSGYTEATVAMYEKLRAKHPAVGLCLQSYLHRTPLDVNRLLPLEPRIRLVKGAYNEPPELAYRRKPEVDAAYREIARTLIRASQEGGTQVALATHDLALLERIGGDCEVQMLYGIRVGDQRRLAAAGRPLRVLISYGSEWFAWYMRRLAERPANVLFALRAALG